MIRLFLVLSLNWAGISGSVVASDVDPTSWFPTNTITYVSLAAPRTWETSTTETSLRQLWNDPSMKAFREDAKRRWHTNVVSELERRFGLQFSNLWSGVTGRVHVGVAASMGWTAVLQGTDLRREFESALAHLDATGKTPSRFQIGSSQAYSIPSPVQTSASDRATTNMLHVVSAAPYLILGDSKPLLEEILKRKEGNAGPGLKEWPGFRDSITPHTSNVLVTAWMNGPSTVRSLRDQLRELTGGTSMEGMAQKALRVLGVEALEAVTATVKTITNGIAVDWMVRVPSQRRAGLFRILAPEPLDATLPNYVPTNAALAMRIRVDGSKVWSELERALSTLSPEMASVLKLVVDTLGKDLNPPVDFRRQVLERLGDDWTLYRTSASTGASGRTNTPSTVLVLGGERARHLLPAVRALFSIAPNAGDEEALQEMKIEDQSVLRYRTIAMDGTARSGETNYVFFAGLADSLVITQGENGMREHLRMRREKPHGLASLPGARAAMLAAGGASGGLASIHQLQLDLIQPWEELRGAALENRPPANPNGTYAGPLIEKLESLDWKLLPPFQSVARHFYFSGMSGSAQPEGIRWNWVWLNAPKSPTP